MEKVLAVLAVTVALLLASGLRFAHHSNAVVDKDNATTLTGTVTRWMFANPHPAVY